MKDIYRKLTLKIFSIPKKESIQQNIKAFSPSEKLLFFILIFIFIGSVVLTISNINKHFLIEVPAYGGNITEGVVGSPRFINPLLATSNADRDLTVLVYSALMKADQSNNLIEDLAESYTISDDGFIYEFTLKDDIYFHDGVEITTEDIIFTIQKTQDANLKSPKRANWDGVNVEKINNKQIRFTLKQPYAPFLENTTLGILPKHIWEKVNIEQFAFSKFNNEPIGSGPYKIDKIKYNSDGTPKFYELKSFDKYALGKPFISKIKIVFYQNETSLLEGYKNKNIKNINSISPDKLSGLGKSEAQIKKSSLPRIFAVFFNQNEAPVFVNKEVREALNIALDKNKIINTALEGYGISIDGPIPRGLIKKNETENNTGKQNEQNDRKIIAKEILENNGWKFNEELKIWEKKNKKESSQLKFSLSTSNTAELKKTAEIIAEEWRDIGVIVDIKLFESGDLNQNIIRPRKYDALLFGEIISRELDLFAFWHSSQRNDPGLNIALYANITADKLLEDARATTDKNVIIKKYIEFQNEIKKDIPAVFIYSPDFIYITPKNIKSIKLGTITTPEERFLNIHGWYIETDKIWDFFTK